MRGARVVLISDAAGAVRAFGGNFVPEIPDDGPASVTSAQAAQVAQAATDGEVLAPPVAEILDLGTLGRRAAPLAWSVETSRGVVWVDAHTAEILYVGDAPGFDVTIFDPREDESTVPGTRLSRTVHLDTSGRFTRTGRCLGDCTLATVFAGEADDFFENGMGRVGGWSGGGNSLLGEDAIEASAPYSIQLSTGTASRFDRVTHVGLTLLDGSGEVVTDVSIGPTAELAVEDLSRDGVTHEFGHGALAVDLQMRRTDMMMSCGARGVSEHVADTFAMLADATAGEPIDTQRPRNNRLESRRDAGAGGPGRVTQAEGRVCLSIGPPPPRPDSKSEILSPSLSCASPDAMESVAATMDARESPPGGAGHSVTSPIWTTASTPSTQSAMTACTNEVAWRAASTAWASSRPAPRPASRTTA
ncbi:MAG: hypothetical protein U0353_14105 [Sandaracinus sp.]